MCPIYEYYCEECQREYELMLRVKDLPVKQYCENCGSQLENVPAKPAPFVRGKGSWSTPA